MNKNFPVIRFNGFNNSWKSEILENVVKLTMGQSPKGEYYTNNPDDHILVQGNADMKNGKVVPRVWTTQVTKEAEPDDIILSVRAPVGDVGKTDYPVVLGRGVAGIKGNEFIYQSLLRMDYIEYWKKYTTGSTFESINSKDLKTAIIKLPESEEQIKIGDFFKHLDEKIELSQHALHLLKQRKKAFLQKMIPSKGESVPEIRFSGFSDNWETVSINDIFKVTRGKVLAVNKVNENQSDEFKYPVYSSQTKNQGLLGYYTDYLYDTAITWTTDGANAGTVNFREGKFYSTNVNGVLLSDEGYANKAVAEILNKIAWKYVSKVGNPKLMNNIMSEIKISIPSLEEQLIIGNFFKKLDDSITLQEEKIESLKQMKKAFLQKMFV